MLVGRFHPNLHAPNVKTAMQAYRAVLHLKPMDGSVSEAPAPVTAHPRPAPAAFSVLDICQLPACRVDLPKYVPTLSAPSAQALAVPHLWEHLADACVT